MVELQYLQRQNIKELRLLEFGFIYLFIYNGFQTLILFFYFNLNGHHSIKTIHFAFILLWLRHFFKWPNQMIFQVYVKFYVFYVANIMSAADTLQPKYTAKVMKEKKRFCIRWIEPNISQAAAESGKT